MEQGKIKRLFIAEKPSLARAIADAMPGRKKRTPLYIEVGDNVVCWAAGHIITPLQPDEYGPEYKSWISTKLPIIPDKWKMKPNARSTDLLKNIGELLKRAESVVNAGDADREGQLLVDEILLYHGYKGDTYRLLVTDMNREAIQKSIETMKPNKEYENVFFSALCRQRADWIFGNNLTRLYSITTNKKWGEKITVGRVQTPTLALVVKRDYDIENFDRHPFYVVKAQFSTEKGDFLAKWKPKDDIYGLDEKGRIVSEKLIEKLKEKIMGKDGTVIKAEKKKSNSFQPLPHSLPTLQIEASKEYGISPADTLETVQNLYEAKLVTYPRSDCAYLPESLYEERNKTMDTIAKMLPGMEENVAKADREIKTKAWDTEKVEEHFAIIPTGATGKLDGVAEQIYELIARRYLAQFYPPQIHRENIIEIEVEGELFRSRHKKCIQNGWQELYKKAKKEKDTSEENEEKSRKKLPELKTQDTAKVTDITKEAKKTSPPEKFTEATLIEAMNNIHRFVENEKIREVLKETSGIGTAATQAGIIELLKDRQYVEMQRKRIVSTEKGRKLINMVGPNLSTPDRTAIWEMQLKQIEKGEIKPETFIHSLIRYVTNVVKYRMRYNFIYVIKKDTKETKAKYKCPYKNCNGLMSKFDGPYGKYWRCFECGLSLSDVDGFPQSYATCPSCSGISVRIKGHNGWFWHCKNKECKQNFPDVNGKPERLEHAENSEQKNKNGQKEKTSE